VPYDIDLGPVMLSDWYHEEYHQIVWSLLQPRPDMPAPISDNNLINGKMNFDCSRLNSSTYISGADCTNNAGYSQFTFQAGKSHRLRLMNTGAAGAQQFSIDDHILRVMANDFVPVEPYDTDVVTLGISQRTDIVVKANGDPAQSYWMRSTITCSNADQPEARAIIHYDNTSTYSLPHTTAQSYGNVGCANDELTKTVPSYSIAIKEPETTKTVTMTVAQNETGSWLWYLNDSSYFGDTSKPMLLLAEEGKDSFSDPKLNVYNMGSNSSFRFVGKLKTFPSLHVQSINLATVNNESPIWHPMHLHGHNMFILVRNSFVLPVSRELWDILLMCSKAEGDGTWDGHVVRPSNPQRRDAQQVRPHGYMVWQVNADNPGAWPFHCHIAWHLSSGMAIDVLERPDDIHKLPIPEERYEQCRQWALWQAGLVPQIDSGV